MIILITGASHTGKTLLAQRMLEKYKYPYLSIDHLKMGLIRSGNTELTPEDDEALTEYLWPIIREIVKTAIENQQNLIVEGCYIPFGWRRDYDERYLPYIRFICLAMSERYVESHFGEIIGYESEIETRMIDADCTIDCLKTDNKSVIDGFHIPREHVRIITLNFQPWEIVLASDGYPFLCPTLAESESRLHQQRTDDPLNIGTFKATKAFHPDFNSFDDRSYIRLKV